MEVFYSGEPETMDTLGRFFRQTVNKPLVVLDEADTPVDYLEFV
jgi:hypothetical protein